VEDGFSFTQFVDVGLKVLITRENQPEASRGDEGLRLGLKKPNLR
jgi:hypothetical protein